ncbi:MAG TPA: MerR family transcriptional regulator [Pyrinomonadaceae bacterium]|jgi:DNA-binding transcriptional MerR regulator
MSHAAVAIPEKLFFKIGEVCDLTGVQAHVLRYWESEFPMLSPQKNRAGQRTYRKRDVEIALRIKELLYDDQYTIAGAKKRLATELRGASKLKVVTPEMSAPQTPPPAPVPAPAPTPAQHFAEAQAIVNEAQTFEATRPMTDEEHDAVRQLAGQLRELLSLLDAGEAGLPRRGK